MTFHQGVLVPIPYLPSVSWFVKVWSNRTVCWNWDEFNDKRRPRNRCLIATAQGAQTLSVPLEGGRNQRTKLIDLKTSHNDKWRREHIHALRTAYGKSPYFIHYADELFNIILQSHDSLAQLNLSLIQLLLKMMRVEVEVVDRSKVVEDVEMKINLIKYPQVFEHVTGFIQDCSAVDLLFNCGPDSCDIIKRASHVA